MIKLTRKIILSIITLILTLLALGTTTFAWFTLSKVATVSNISANVQGGEGLEVALGIGNTVYTSYKTNLTSDDWQLVLQELPNMVLNAVTTDDLIDFHTLKFQKAFGSTPAGLYKTAAVANVDYLDFTIFFKSNSGGNVNFIDYHFTDDGLLFSPTIEYDRDDTGIAIVNSFDAYASNAARLSVNNQVYQNSVSLDNTHTSNSAVNYGQFSYITEMGNDIYWTDDKLIVNKDLPLQLLPNEILLSSIGIMAARTSIPDPLLVPEQIPLVQNGNTYQASANIKIWIEGFDADAYDSIFGTSLQLNLSFEKEIL